MREGAAAEGGGGQLKMKNSKLKNRCGRRKKKLRVFPLSKPTSKCKGCGFRVSADSEFCGECLCEEDGL